MYAGHIHKCGGVLHEGQSCSEVQRAKADAKMKKMLDDSLRDGTMKPCPNCHVPIYKTEGCNHMTCGDNDWQHGGAKNTQISKGHRRCFHEFCWNCLKVYTGYADKVDPRWKRWPPHERCNGGCGVVLSAEEVREKLGMQTGDEFKQKEDAEKLNPDDRRL